MSSLTSPPPCPLPPVPFPSPLPSVDTPSLILSLPRVHANLTLMRSTIAELGVDLRPHVKTHKCVELAELCIRKQPLSDDPFPGGGATGLCFQVLDELQPCLDSIDMFSPLNHGNPKLPGSKLDFFLTSQVLHPPKLRRLFELASAHEETTLISVMVDAVSNLETLAELSASHKTNLGVFVEVNVGQNRTGLPVTDDTLSTIVEMAEKIEKAPYLTYRGLHAYQGVLQHTRDSELRAAEIKSAVDLARTARDALAEAGLPPPVVTGAGTASYHEEARLGVHNEVQPGSFMLMDTDYGDNRKRADDEAPDFQHALWIHSSVMSTAMDERKVIIDAGSKAVDLVSGVPSFTDQADNWGMNGVRKDESVEFSSGGDEHGILTLKGGEYDQEKVVGADSGTVRLLPRHIDPQMNMHDRILVIEEEGSNVVTKAWNVHGRGPGF